MTHLHSQQGFTLIEVLVAIGILSIGIFSLMTMQTTSVRGNASANAISEATVIGADEIEKILDEKFNDTTTPTTAVQLTDTDSDGLAGLTDSVCCQDGNDPAGTPVSGCNDPSNPAVNKADFCLMSGKYFLYVNVAEDEPLTEAPNTSKTIRVYVKRPDRDGPRDTVAFDYFRTLSL
ncbi:MAG: prepilin-type N-terminal cleavage/methylation domain-containing protein [Desulfopila sp.]